MAASVARRKLRLHRDSWAKQRACVDDHLIACLEPSRYQPVGSDGAIGLDHPKLGHVVGPDDDDGWASPLVAPYRTLRDEDAARLDTLRKLGANEHAGKQDMLGIGENRADSLRSGRLVNRNVSEAEPADEGIDRAGFELKPDRRRILRDLAGDHLLTKPEEVRARFLDTDINRVEPLNRGQWIVLPALDQRAGRVERT